MTLSNPQVSSTCSNWVGSFILVRLKGFEPPTYWFVASHSIQLSYSRILFWTLCIPDS